MDKEEKKRIERILTALADRKTIDPKDDKEGIIKKQLTEDIDKIRKYVRNSAEGAGAFKCFWIFGQTGSGKSQNLLSMAHNFRTSLGGEKIAISKVDINDDNARLLAELEEKIFEKSFSVGSPISDTAKAVFKDGLKLLNKKIDKEESQAKELMEFGIKLVEDYIDFPLPPVIKELSILTFNIGANAVKHSRWNIRRCLLEKQPELSNDYELLDFMVRWICFCLKPTYDKQKELFSIASEHSKKENLFKLVCQMLQKSSFTTFIILIDEFSSLKNDQLRRVLDHFKNNSQNINIVVICTCLPETFNFLSNDEQLRSRFFSKGTVFSLPEPEVLPNCNLQDDFSFAKTQIIDLCGKIGKDYNRVSEREEERVRLELIEKKSRKKLTWSILWEEVSNLFNPFSLPR